MSLTLENRALSSSSSSSSGSDFGSSGSRSTTPSSIESSPSHCKASEAITSVLPSIYAYVPLSCVHHNVLKAIFEKHALDGRLGIYFRTSTSPPAGSVEDLAAFSVGRETSQWTTHRAPTDRHPVNGTEFDYFVSTSSATAKFDLALFRPLVNTSPQHAQHLLTISIAGLRSIISLPAANGYSTLHILEQPSFVFLPLSQTPCFNPSSSKALTTKRSFGNVPTPEEWDTLWSAWDLVTLQMIPQEMLHQKPIDLRHKCLFYIGHIPTFLDMLISKAIGGCPTEPKHFWTIFERGIDPHVDDPDHCHNHSEVPEADEDWPTLESIIGFRDGVRARLMRLYDDLRTGKRVLTRNIARTLVMTLEHEGFHVETLLYMLIQRAGTGTLPPPGFVVPPWELLARQWNALPGPSTSTVKVGPSVVTLGHDDCEGDDKLEDIAEDVEGRVFGWDNESPARTVPVAAFRADWRPVSNAEFEAFWTLGGRKVVDMPKSWVEEDGEIKVRTMYGPVGMEFARHWPVLTSYDHFTAYAKSKGGRLPTEAELRLFLDQYDLGHEGGANSGFRNWHPVPATTGLAEHGGKGSNGGVWEWTSTLFDHHDGLSPTNLFTGYSTDFFDNKHQIVLGASYATIPRLASRRTVRNFYQHNYPYSWVGGRVVYDL